MSDAHRQLAAVTLALCATAWLAAISAAPRIRGGARSPALAGAASAFHVACGRICHQQASRSWSTSGVAWPVCARCTGLYAGAVAGAWLACVACWRFGRGTGPARRAESLRAVLLVAVLPTTASWAVERVGWLETSNAVRFALALPLGAVIAWALVSMAGGRVD